MLGIYRHEAIELMKIREMLINVITVKPFVQSL